MWILVIFLVTNLSFSTSAREGQYEPMADTSSRKPRSPRINQLLGQIHELEFLDREIKINNARLTMKNTELHNSILEMRGMYVLLKRINMRLMKDYSSIYKMVTMLRFQKKDPNPKKHLALETLAKATITLQDLEVAHDVFDIPNLMQVEEVKKWQE